MSVSCCAAPIPTVSIPAASSVVVVHTATTHPGRHRRPQPAYAGLGRTIDVIARLGSLVTLASLLVLAGAVAGLADGVPAGDSATVTVTFDGGGH